MKNYANHIITPQQITILFSEGDPVSIYREDSRYNELLRLICKKDYNSLVMLADQSEKIVYYTKGKFLVKDGIVIIDGDQLPETLSNKLLELIDSKEDTIPLERFWKNLKKNPSKESIKDMFSFLRANKFPITRSGCFIGYKKVKSNYKDCHTGTISNRPGEIVKMLREQVNADRNMTCSYGLHVAAYSYANKFSDKDGILLEVEVNPRDVVSVPIDYDQQKMRVCRYRVIRKATKELSDLIYKHEPSATEFEKLGDDNQIEA